MPRFGRNRVIQVLVGSHGKEVLDAGLNELTTYGLLKQKSSNYLHELFREMEEAELIYSTGGQYPMIGLAELGVAVMQNAASFDLVWPEERRSRKQKEVVRELENEAPFDPDLYEVLRKTRATLAQEQGGVPHYLIFPDETLKAFARLKPSSIESARRIRGVGEVKAARYMETFLRAIQEFRFRVQRLHLQASAPSRKSLGLRWIQNGSPARREEGAYLDRYVTDEQRSRRPIFNATLWAAAGWRFFLRRGGSTAMIQLAALRSRLEKQPTDLRRSPRDLGDGALELKLHHFLDPFLDQPWAVVRGGPESEEREGRLLKQVVEQLISQTPVSALMGGIIELDGGNGMKVFRLGQNKIHVFASDRTKDAVPGRSACAGDNNRSAIRTLERIRSRPSIAASSAS